MSDIWRGNEKIGFFRYVDKFMVLSPWKTIATFQRSIWQHFWARGTTYCARLATQLWHVRCHVVGLSLKMVKYFMMLYSFVQVHATVLRRGVRFNSICNTQHFATRRNRVAKRANGRAVFLRLWLIHLHFRVSMVISIFSCLVLCHSYSFKIFLGHLSLRSVGEGLVFGGDPPLQVSNQ